MDGSAPVHRAYLPHPTRFLPLPLSFHAMDLHPIPIHDELVQRNSSQAFQLDSGFFLQKRKMAYKASVTSALVLPTEAVFPSNCPYSYLCW